MAMLLQTNPEEKKARLQQLIEWGYIDSEEAESMYEQYCLIFRGCKMKVSDVITEYHKKCSFPWTPRKLKKKGYDAKTMLIEIREKLALCTDRKEAKSAELIDALMAIDI